MWFATGKEDFLVATSRATVEMLKKHGFEVVYKETGGPHLDQLAQLPERVRAAAVPVNGRRAARPVFRLRAHPVLLEERLETRVAAERVPGRVEPEQRHAQAARPRQQLPRTR